MLKRQNQRHHRVGSVGKGFAVLGVRSREFRSHRERRKYGEREQQHSRPKRPLSRPAWSFLDRPEIDVENLYRPSALAVSRKWVAAHPEDWMQNGAGLLRRGFKSGPRT